ncbi:baseplate J/gp47 family protein [Bacillus tianshenii]|nr:baseplate J/gp47 family protein [Bacillus tianshenii]
MADDAQKRMLANINDEFDKSVGSFFYDITGAVAVPFNDKYKALEQSLDDYFISTSSNEDIIEKRVAEQGITRKAATFATGYVTITGQQGAAINEGDKVASDFTTYTIQESKVIGASRKASVLVMADEAGMIGNCPVGSIKYFPVTLSGLTTVTNDEEFSNGYDQESIESLKERYFEKVRTPATSGNKYHYRNWAKEVIGVGDAKVFPQWNGSGTVKVVIIDSNGQGASQNIIDSVFSHIEEERPICVDVTVVSATEKAINLVVDLIIDTNNYALQEVQTIIENSLNKYLKTLAFAEDYVSYGQIGNLILDSEGVIDYSNLLVNGDVGNVLIGEEEVAVLGTITTNG